MKKILIFSWLILFLSPMVRAQEKIEAPIWNIGDKWTYENPDGGKFSFEVIDITGDGFVVKRGNSSYVYDKNTLNHKFTIYKGEKERANNIERKMLDFPIFVGKKWHDQIEFIGQKSFLPRTNLTEYRVEGLEDIVIPVGNLKVFRILAKVSIQGFPESHGWIKYWYSPEIKFWVKNEFEKTPFWPTHKDAVLIRYKLNKKVKDTKDNQSNVLSGGTKVATVTPEIPKDAQDQTKWLGLWTGILAGKQKNRILEINQVSEESGKANYGIVGGKKLQPISVIVKGEQVSFTTPPGSKVELKRSSEFRMDGTFEAKGSDPVPIQFWKKPTDENLDPQLKAFLGTWQGKSYWEGAPFQKPNLEFDMKITVAYIDSTAAAVLRENSEFISLDGYGINANWCWCHATVTRKKTIEFPFWSPKGIFVCKLSSDLKYLYGEVKGLGAFEFSPNSFKLKRADN